MRIQDIANELEVPASEVLAKANAMGIEASSQGSRLSEADTLAVKNALGKGGGDAETKIIRVKPKTKEADKKDETVRTTKKAKIQLPVRQPRSKPDDQGPGRGEGPARRDRDRDGDRSRDRDRDRDRGRDRDRDRDRGRDRDRDRDRDKNRDRDRDRGRSADMGAGGGGDRTKPATEVIRKQESGAPKVAAPIRPAGQALTPVSVGPFPTRIPSEQVIPKRISREEIEAEVKKTTGDPAFETPERADQEFEFTAGPANGPSAMGSQATIVVPDGTGSSAGSVSGTDTNPAAMQETNQADAGSQIGDPPSGQTGMTRPGAEPGTEPVPAATPQATQDALQTEPRVGQAEQSAAQAGPSQVTGSGPAPQGGPQAGASDGAAAAERGTERQTIAPPETSASAAQASGEFARPAEMSAAAPASALRTAGQTTPPTNSNMDRQGATGGGEARQGGRSRSDTRQTETGGRGGRQTQETTSSGGRNSGRAGQSPRGQRNEGGQRSGQSSGQRTEGQRGEGGRSQGQGNRRDGVRRSEGRQDGRPDGRQRDRQAGAGRPGDSGRQSPYPPRTPKKKTDKDGEVKKDDKARQGDAKNKPKDKKPIRSDKGKAGEAYGDKARKHKLQTEKRKGSVDDFKGSRRSPILEDNSLEKRPVRSTRRPRPQPKPEPEKRIREEDLAPGTKIIHVPITVAGFAEQVERSTTEIIMTLMGLGIMANINQNIDETTTQLLGEELGIPIVIGSDAGEIVEEGLEIFEDDPDDLQPRPPIITVMGHVDHGKTSLLDAIRKTNVTVGEAGGITQHIGASEALINGEKIVFLDTPGHEAFTAMRARGAHITDIAVLVVAADDGVMPQTLESISHAKAAGVPIIVAINKMDKEGANPDRVRQELADHGVLVEEWGGDTISVPVSARSGEGVVNLLEMILLQAEVLELKANPDRLAMGTVIEARLDKNKGSVATLLVLNGTLDAGASIVAGTTSGRIRAMVDYNGQPITAAGPATAVEITGLAEVPQAGDEFNAVREDRTAREIAESRRIRLREEIMARTSGASLETLFSRIQEGEIKELNIIIKGDVQGSVGALTSSLEKLDTENVRVRIIHTGVGAVTESDVMLASTSGAVIIGFNVRPTSAVTSLAERDGVEIRTYRVIYDAIDDVEAALKGMLDPVYREVVQGKVEIRETFKVPGVGVIGGSYVLEGKVQRNSEVRLIRDGIVVHEGRISSLKRFKDDAKEVATGFECGIGLENYNDVKEGDIIEAFMMEEIERE